MYTTEQVVFTFAWLAYRGGSLPFTPTRNAPLVLNKLRKEIRALPPLGDAWEIAWGPVLHRSPFVWFDDGMMVVVREKADPARLVIAIRGTNPASVSTWLFQNFMVGDTVRWPFGDAASTPNLELALGTYQGLTTLLDLAPSPELPGNGTRLLDFLRREVETRGGLDITVTGHSLGGVLASTLSLSLADLQAKGASVGAAWDPEERSRLTTYSFAAPTAGNRDFAAYTDARIGGTLHRIWNTLDIVPHAWDSEMLAAIPILYADFAIPDPLIEGARRLATIAVEPIGYRHPLSGDEPFTAPAAKTVPVYGAHAIHHHGQAYLDFMKLADILSVPEIVFALQPPQAA
ncbi:Hypothetical protein A7982_09878 [Minicystis rosea]|nr:Hypothetical protein A7982_09878 [Minicystis rosea]